MFRPKKEDEKRIEELTKDWGNLKTEDMIRGHTPSDIEKRCLELCANYISGSWKNAQTTADITVKRVSGGFTNQLYHIHLNESVPRVERNAIYPDEPNDVAIKFYQEKHMKNYNKGDDERLNDTIILTIMSQTGFGPKIYGIFNDGFVQHFYKHEQFRAKHQENPVMLKKVIRLLAEINHLNVPIYKGNNLLFDDISDMFEFAYENCKVEELSEKLNLTSLKSVDLRVENQKLIKLINSMNIPQVFTHNDFRGSNLLVVDDKDGNQNVLACDLEYCGYGSRGFDLASFMMEWGKSDMTDMNTKTPSDDELRSILKMYSEECERLSPGYQSRPENSIDNQLRELKVMMLANTFFFLGIMIKQTESIVPSMPFDAGRQMGMVDFILKNALEFKQLLVNEKIINLDEW